MIVKSETFDSAIAVDVEAIQWWENIGRMSVVMVRPRGNRVATNVGVRNPSRLDIPSDYSLGVVESQGRLHWVCSVYVVPELRWQKPLQTLFYCFFLFFSINIYIYISIRYIYIYHNI
jgi:hypothetical protein